MTYKDLKDKLKQLEIDHPELQDDTVIVIAGYDLVYTNDLTSIEIHGPSLWLYAKPYHPEVE